EQVDVVALDAEVDDPEVLAQRGGERRFADRLVHAATAQVADRADDPQHHVHGVAFVVRVMLRELRVMYREVDSIHAGPGTPTARDSARAPRPILADLFVA